MPVPVRSTIMRTVAALADALDRLSPARPRPPTLSCDACLASGPAACAVARVNRVDMSLLKGIDRVRDLLIENTERFARGLPANNALLWGARGMGKSSLVKASHAATNAARPGSAGARPLKLVEIHREDIESLPDLMVVLRGVALRCIVFCDDLSFDADDTSYKSLKAVLEGGIEGRPDNVILRHLQPAPPDAAARWWRTSAPRRSIRESGRGEWYRCRTASAVLGSTAAARTSSSHGGAYCNHYRIPPRQDAGTGALRCGRHPRSRWAVSPGNRCKTSRGGSAFRWRSRPPR